MPKPIRRNTGMWEYLEQSGVLESGNEEAIEAVKKEYKRQYQRKYRKQKRKERPEVTITLAKPDWLKLTHAAQQHHYSLPSFIKHAALSYLNQTYLVPDREPVSRLEQRLRLCQTDIRMIARHVHKRNLPELNQAYLDLAERINHMETIIHDAFHHPPKLS
ncbi:MAG: hypothetical protein R8P61_28330 [Bacteroidia bacterium]|nr:hypothetical protein [Bacteroidia bacterium]